MSNEVRAQYQFHVWNSLLPGLGNSEADAGPLPAARRNGKILGFVEPSEDVRQTSSGLLTCHSMIA
jgi:hypothetical protein